MIAVTTYTTYDDVRQACSLSSEDLSDTELGKSLYANELYITLASMTPAAGAPGTGTVMERLDAIMAKDEGDRTALEVMYLVLGSLLATYVVASVVMRSLSLRTPKMETDGKRSQTKFSGDATFLSVASAVTSRLQSLLYAMANFGSSTSLLMPMLAAAEPDIDPVLEYEAA